ncbi:ParA family protein [Actinomadura sp. 9N215]|uniref:ParA family protein n=1 Tax=Actinomadura sp. 9N215 TaxID=3375150 RepID=UPI0037A1DE73
MAATDAGAEREKIVSKLPPWLRQELKVRAAELRVDIQNAVEAGIKAWLTGDTAPPEVDTAGAESFSTWLPEGMYDDLKAACATRSVSYVQGLAQAVTLWLAAHPSPRTAQGRGEGSRRKIVGNQKGGVGKTAISAGLGAAYAEAGERVLIVDYDPQGHLSNQLGVPQIVAGEDSLAKHMAGEAKSEISELIVTLAGERFGDRLHVLPACADGFLLDVKLSQVRAREAALERALAPVEDHYDVIIVDCPPSLGLSMDAGLHYGRRRPGEPAGTSGVLIPVQAEDSSADAFGMLMNQIADLQDDLQIQIDHLGIVVNLYDARRGYIATSSLANWKSLGEPPVVAVIPDLKEQREAVRKHVSLLDYAPDCDQSAVLRKLARELG